MGCSSSKSTVRKLTLIRVENNKFPQFTQVLIILLTLGLDIKKTYAIDTLDTHIGLYWTRLKATIDSLLFGKC